VAVSDDETILICAPVDGELQLPDNLVGKCAECGRRLQYRPHAPKGRMMCLQCALPLIEAANRVVIEPLMIEDAKEYLRKKLH
jgi:hypothetical protein